MENIFQERKTALLNKINQSMDQYVFERALNQSEDEEFLGFTSYQEFTTFQQNFVNRLDEGQLDTFGFLINIEPFLEMLDEESSVVSSFGGFAISSEGKIVLIMPR